MFWGVSVSGTHVVLPSSMGASGGLECAVDKCIQGSLLRVGRVNV